MINIKRIAHDGEVTHYVFDSFPGIHTILLSFFNDLNFSNDELDKLDVIFSELDGEYIFLKSEHIQAHFFINARQIHMVLQTNLSRENLYESMNRYFNFPKQL